MITAIKAMLVGMYFDLLHSAMVELWDMQHIGEKSCFAVWIEYFLDIHCFYSLIIDSMLLRRCLIPDQAIRI